MITDTTKAVNLNKEIFGFHFIKCECGSEMGVKDVNATTVCTTCNKIIKPSTAKE